MRCFRRDGTKQPLVEPNENDEESSSWQVASRSVAEMSTDEEMDNTRLSRRSSVLNDLMSLFRRSSSAIRAGHHSSRVFSATEEEGEDEEIDGEPRPLNKDKILEKIRKKRENIGKLRSQPWPMHRKRRTLRVAKGHLERQEARVSKMQLYKVEASRRFHQLSRWIDNCKIYLIPWEAKIKKIESHFGSVVSSYFTFLRWTLSVNIIMSLIMFIFVILPEWMADSRMQVGSERFNRTQGMKIMPEDVRNRADEIFTVWDLGGHMQYSLLFYGYYSRETFFGETVKYRVPVAYFLVNLFVLGYSLFTILRKMAANARSSKLTSGKTEQYVFAWKAFTGWDYTIGNPETASNVQMANVIKFREGIAEHTMSMKKRFTCTEVMVRIFTNVVVSMMCGFSIWAIYRANNIKNPETFLEQNAVAITVSFITLIFPNFFELIGKMEGHHPRFALRLQLFRVLALYVCNYYTLITSLMLKLDMLETEREEMARAAQTSGSVSLNRSLRQVLGLPTSHSYFNYATLSPPKPTTPTAPTVWTTVLPDFGPFGIANPKVVVTNDRSHRNTSTVLTQAIGPGGTWNLTGEMVTLTPYTSGPQRLRQSQYGDLCWETIIGQEITKLVTMDLLMTIAAILVIDFFRGLFCRFANLWWFWNLELTFPEYGEFKVAENVLHLVNNQGMIWLGVFFVPMLPAINNLKLIIVMYVRAWAVMTCNVPARQIFRASRSSNFYLSLLLLIFFMGTLPVGYVIASRKPSATCGPFGNQPHFYSVIIDVLNENLNASMVGILRYMMSPGIVVPALLLLLLVVYFMFALIRGLREANTDLTNQLMHERTEEKRKIFELAGGNRKRSQQLLKKKREKDRELAKAAAKKLAKQQNSSDEESFGRSVASRSSGKAFIPSLGSVSEVDQDDEEKEENENRRRNKNLTLKQKFFICIGWSDPHQYDALPDDENIEEGRIRGSSVEDDTRDSDRNQLLPENARKNGSSRRSTPKSEGRRSREKERSKEKEGILNKYLRPLSNRNSEEKSKSGDISYRTASAGSRMEEVVGEEIEMSQRTTSNSASGSWKNRSQPLKTEFVSPQLRILFNPMDQLNVEGQLSPPSWTSSSTSPSGSASLPADSAQCEKAARNLLRPVIYQNPPQSKGESDIADQTTRPPSTDASLSEPIQDWNNGNPHSSYTSAMMSPIMVDMIGVEEEEDKNKSPDVVLSRPPLHDTPRSIRSTNTMPASPSTPRAPRFRISMSPPRKPLKSQGSSDGSVRRFEMRTTEDKTQANKEAIDNEGAERQSTL